MPLILEQSFPLGRIHATRWNQNPFEDPYGEWPPSPWRLLRALAARWFQFQRETGESDEKLRDRLLDKLARTPPDYQLPASSWRGVPVRQYHPTAVAWSDGQAKNPGYKRPGTTLVQDHYRAVPADEPLYWVWEKAELEPAEADLLRELLSRLLYFGRAESHCRVRIVRGEEVKPNCRLNASAGVGQPVLCPTPGVPLDINALLAVTDSDLLKQRRIPPGTAWLYAQIPPRPAGRPTPTRPQRHPVTEFLQFAVGGRVYPPEAHWVKLTERFRDAVIHRRCIQFTGSPEARYRDLDAGQRDALSLIRGIDGAGGCVDGAATTFFALIPGEGGQPTRLACWRASPFSDEEIDAFLAATQEPLRWEFGSDDWRVRLVPLPSSVPRPAGYWSSGKVWVSTTPFVLPAGRHRVRRKGKPRIGESPEASLQKLLVRYGLPEPQVEQSNRNPGWVTIHETPGERGRRVAQRGTRMRPGHCFRITFPHPIPGPLCVGHSCHFGLGLFRLHE
jgi:CRISPR-associated protein Csb2